MNSSVSVNTGGMCCFILSFQMDKLYCFLRKLRVEVTLFTRRKIGVSESEKSAIFYTYSKGLLVTAE